jgi:hypothetical protein
MHETYGSVEMYTIYNLLFFIFYIPMPLPDTLKKIDKFEEILLFTVNFNLSQFVMQ